MKKILSLLLALTIALALVSCGSENSAQQEVVIPDELTDEIITIEMWHTMGEENMATLDEIIADFNEIYPNITITHAAQGSYETLRDNVTTAITGGNAPDLVLAYPDHTAVYLSGEAVIPLDAFINNKTWGLSEDHLADFIPSYLAEGKVYDEEGTYYALPFNKSTELMFYNKTALSSVPTTWDEVADTGLVSYTDANGETITPEYFVSYDSSSNMFITLSEQYNTPYTGFENGEGSYLFVNDVTKGMLADVMSMYEAKTLTIPSIYDQDYGSVPFAEGKTLASIGSSAGAKYNATLNFEVGVTTVPQKDVNNKKVIQQGTNINLLNQNTDQERLAAWLFMKHLVSTEANTKFAISSGYLPVVQTAYESAEYKTFIAAADQTWDMIKDDLNKVSEYLKAKASVVAYEQRDAYFTSVSFIGSSKARDEVGFIIENLFLLGADIDTELDNAYEELTW